MGDAAPSMEEVTGTRRLAGTTLAGRYELLAFAAAGGMGHVYRARDLERGGLVAVKVLPPSGGDAERFAREASVLAAIDHPGVVRYLDRGTTDDGAQYLVMEWLAGQDLSDRLGDGALSVHDTLLVARHAAEALAAAHARGIVHRDLKPANLFLVDRRFDAIKLLDFGIARVFTERDLTVTGTVVGTPAYMSPEQVRGEGVDPRADVYGLGAVIFRCLAGHPPFRGAHHLAILAKVILEPAPQLREACPDAPPELEALVLRALAKDPSKRPADGAALLEALRAIDAQGSAVHKLAPAVSTREQRVACVVLCAGSGAHEPTVVESQLAANEDAVRRAVEEQGGVIDALSRGAWVITVKEAASPAEQATRAVRCALAIAALRPSAPVFVATGRVLVGAGARFGEVIDRAADALVEARRERPQGGVRLDAATAALLEGRFRIRGDGAWRELAGEEDGAAPGRTLLGKPAPCIGREPQLAMLASTFAASAYEPRAAAAMITAPPGLGKTRLLHELLRAAIAPRGDVDLLFARAEPIRAASPFAIAAQIVKRAAGILDSDDAIARGAKLAKVAEGHVAELLGEICGLAVPHAQASASLRAARADPATMADAVREAWIEWLGARAARAPVALVIEDAHWADPPSLRLVDAALAVLEGRPLFVLATARPEVHAAFPGLFRARGLVEIALAPLSPKASERLVREALGASAKDDVVRALVQRAGGHPFHLEELVRAAAAGRGDDRALPDSVLGMVQARLDALGARPRRLLRAASVFGETFWPGGVASLLGEGSAADVVATLDDLVRHEVVTVERAPKWHDEPEYRFRHALVRDAAYAMLAEADRVRAHRRAGAWLEDKGETDAVVLAEHYDRGQAPEQACAFFARAAALALARSDFDGAMDHARRALALGPDADGEARLFAIEAEVMYWRGDLARAAERASAAAERLARGTPGWFEAVSVAAGALGQLGKNDDVASWIEEAANARSSAEARAPRVVALCRALSQLAWAHHARNLAPVRAKLDALVDSDPPLDAYPRAWVHRVRGESAWLHAHDVGRCLSELDASCAAFDAARAVRALCHTRINAASLAGWAGAPARGLSMLAKSRAEAERLGAGFIVRYGRAVEGLLLAYGGDPGALAAMRAAFEGVRGSPRLAFVCHFVCGWLALEAGDVGAAEEDARAAIALPVVDDLKPAALALSARAHVARGRAGEALAAAREAESLESSRRDLELTFGTGGLALAEALDASGDRAAAKAALARVVGRLDAIARTIPAADRESFWARRMPNDRVRELARAWSL